MRKKRAKGRNSEDGGRPGDQPGEAFQARLAKEKASEHPEALWVCVVREDMWLDRLNGRLVDC